MESRRNQSRDHRVAILIDGDNASPSMISNILTEAGKQGIITIKKIYGDWTTNSMNGWKEVLNNHAVQPVQQFRYTVGKNATDSAMIIDAMDILHAGLVDAFCLVSSDSDYTRLATRLREAGLVVLGIGEQKTPRPFVNACNLFTYTENLKKESQPSKSDSKKPNPLPILQEAFDLAVNEDGWAHLATMGAHLQQLDPGFDPRSFGFAQLSQLIKSLPKHFELKYEDERGPSAVYVRQKTNTKS